MNFVLIDFVVSLLIFLPTVINRFFLNLNGSLDDKVVSYYVKYLLLKRMNQLMNKSITQILCSKIYANFLKDLPIKEF